MGNEQAINELMLVCVFVAFELVSFSLGPGQSDRTVEGRGTLR